MSAARAASIAGCAPGTPPGHYAVPNVADALALVTRFAPGADERATASRARTLALLSQSSHPFSRHNFDPGHVTASGVVLSADDTEVLLIYHRRLQRWLQPGGHVEPNDRDLPASAEREVREETGVALDDHVRPVLVGVDVHHILARQPDEPPHLHHDVVFRFRARPNALPEPEPGRDVVWCAIRELDRYEVDEPLKRSVMRALQATTA